MRVEHGILPLVSVTPQKLDAGKKDLGDHLIGNMEFWEEHSLFSHQFSRIWCLLKGVALWTIWVEGNNLTSGSEMGCFEDTTNFLTRSLDYARVLWDRALDRTWIEPPLTTTPLVTLTKFEGETGSSITDITLKE